VRYVADDESGSTAVLALVTRTHVAVGNLGDSRIVLLSRGEGRGGGKGRLLADSVVSA
jgi:serine/threonine protein phosphatase PrpC